MASILEKLISEEFTIKGQGRWCSTEEHSSLVYDRVKDMFFFNSRSIAGNAYTWLTRIRGYSHEQAKNYLKQFKEYTDSYIYNIKDSEEVITYPAITEIMFERGNQTDQSYWVARGIDNDTISRFRLGYLDTSDGLGFWTIPVYQDGLFRQVQLRRDIPSKIITRYYKGQPPFLFNSDILHIVSSIVITESPISCLLAMQIGLPCVSTDGGSGYWSDAWYKYFMYCNKISILYDFDSAGIKGAKQICRKLGEYRCKMYNFEDFDEHFGLDNLIQSGYTIGDVKNLIEERAKYVFEL